MNNQNALLILIMPNGDRMQHTMSPEGGRGWMQRQTKSIGKGYRRGQEFAGAVLIYGTDISQYNANETREVLGLA